MAQPQRQRSLLTFARSSGVIWGEASSCFSMVGKTCPELLGVRTCPLRLHRGELRSGLGFRPERGWDTSPSLTTA